MNQENDTLKALIFIVAVLIALISIILFAKARHGSTAEPAVSGVTQTAEFNTLKTFTTKTETTRKESTAETNGSPVEKKTEKATETTTAKKDYVPSPELVVNDTDIEPQFFRKMGRIYADGYWWTWYSERVLPGGGLNIPGRHSDGNYVRDENDYIVLASSELPKGTVLETPFGMGKIYDSGCPYGVIDVYVSW